MRNEKKANDAEQVIQTLKKKCYKYLYHHKTERYIDVLQELVEGYKEGYHSGIKRPPLTVNREIRYKSGQNNIFQKVSQNAKGQV